MRYGHFDDDRREYVITRPDTPLPWINYLGTEDFLALISNTGGGYAFYRDARMRRLTRYRYNNVPADQGSRFIYLRDDDAPGASQAPLFWCPTGQPLRSPLDSYECRHGLGYTQLLSSKAGIESHLLFFVPPGENMEVWRIRLTNQRRRPARLSLFGAVEFCLWDAWDDATNFQRNLSLAEVEVEDGVIYHRTEYRERRNHFAYFAASGTPAGFDTQRSSFLGPYGSWDSPLGVKTGRLTNSIAHGWEPIAALHLPVELLPDDACEFIFLLGYAENPPDEKFDPPDSQTLNKRGVRSTAKRYLQAEVVESAFGVLRANWDELLSGLQVETPDDHTNRMVNVWNPYQLMATFNVSRSASYFESGIGRGIGFRDASQDLLGSVRLVPQRARQRLLDLASTQLSDGGAYHQYQPLTKRGNNDIGSGFNDDPLWLVLATSAYIKETGDFGILDQGVPFDNQEGTEASLEDHLRRALRFTLDRLGPHGLPLIGRADWNDCLNLNCFSDSPGQSFQTTVNKDGKTAESVFIAGLFLLAAQEMVVLTERRGHPAEAESLLEACRAMEQAIWEAGWDGEWFRRAYDDAGRPVGSAECEEGQIYIEPQGICVMAGLGLQDGRARTALDSVAARLATPHGIILHEPAYRRYYLHLGEISSYPPGYKENGGIFCHTNPWIMIAETRAARGDAAYDYYRRINPSAREEQSDVHRCEPYVYAQMIAGREAPTYGEAKNSWLTGAASWNYVAITQWILGVRPTLDGLQIAPVVPSAWKGFDLVRRFRGVSYRIQAERVGPGNDVTLEIGGRPLAGTVVPLPPAGTKEVQVLARLGQA
ncbi:MAG TPA: glycosyl transferase [Anaerolineales bacterium]|nr:glycosyl transferase [Anaerolineales bacterium]